MHERVRSGADVGAVSCENTVSEWRASARAWSPVRRVAKGLDDATIFVEHLWKIEGHGCAGEAGEAANLLIFPIFIEDPLVAFSVCKRRRFLVVLALERQKN